VVDVGDDGEITYVIHVFLKTSCRSATNFIALQ